MRQKNIPIAKARQIMAAAEQVMQKSSCQTTSEKVMVLVTMSRGSASACEFIALAQDLRIPLITSGKRMLRDFPQTAVIRFQFANS